MESAVLIQISCAVLNTVLVAVVTFRRQPPLDQELHRVQIELSTKHPTKEDFHECGKRCKDSVSEVKHELTLLREDLFSRVNDDRKAVQEAVRDFDKRVGKLEGSSERRRG